MQPDRSPLDPETLLAESAWIRRLARSLLRDAHAAEDLSQDVLAAALASQPAFSGARLRGWLAGVTRHLAAGRRARERRRGEVERRAARPEGTRSDAHERLVLHQRLAEAIDALPEPYRETLVQRYLDDRPPRVIARRQCLPVTTVRKRVSRGLAMLRARLDEEFAGDDGQGGRAAWCLACAGLLRRPEGLAALPLIGVVSMSSLVKLAAASAAVLVVALVFTRPWEAAEPSTSPPREEAVPVAAAGEDVQRTTPAPPPEAAEERLPLAASPTETPVAAPRLRVVDEAGNPLPEARVAWFDTRERIIPVELDELGSAPLLENGRGARVLATHEGLAPGHAVLESGEHDLLLTLALGLEVRGRVIENGGFPRRPIRLFLSWGDEAIGLDSVDWKIERELQERGFLVHDETRWTEPDGSFVFSRQRRDARGSLRLHCTHVVADKPITRNAAESVVAVRVDGEPLRIETITLPIVQGRLVWSDDGSPIEDGELSYQTSDQDGSPGPGMTVLADPDGYFAVGLHVESWRALSPELRVAARAQLGTLHLRSIETVSKSARWVSRDLPLEGLSYPHDMGTIALERTRGLEVRVLDAEGHPLAGAAIASAISRILTDERGEATLACWGHAEEEIVVLAEGHALGLFTLGDAPSTEDEPWELRLRPGIELVFELKRPDGGPPRNVELEVSWDETPYQRSERCDAPFDHLHRMLARGGFEGGSWRTVAPHLASDVTFEPDLDGEARMIALLPDKRLRLRLLHARGHTLLEREITTPSRAGVETVEIVVPPEETPASGRVILRGRIVDESGRPPRRASVSIDLGLRWVRLSCDETGAFESGPLEPGVVSYRARASGHVETGYRELELWPGMPPLTIVLPTARKVDLHVHDEAGRMLRLQEIRTTGSTGRSYRGWSAAPGLAVFEQLPREPLVIEVIVGLCRWTRPIGADDLEATLVLPVHGTLVTSFTPEELPAEADSLVLLVDARDGSEPLRVDDWFPFREDAPGPFTVETDLLPGLYRAVVLWSGEPEIEDGEPIETVLLPARDVAVEAGRTTTLSPRR